MLGLIDKICWEGNWKAFPRDSQFRVVSEVSSALDDFIGIWKCQIDVKTHVPNLST